MADPLILTPGQIALPDDFNAVLLQHAPPGVKPVQSVQPVPMTDPKVQALIADAAARGETFDPTQTPLYLYYLADGTMVAAITQPDGQYRVVDYKPSQKFQQAQAAATRQEQTSSQKPVRSYTGTDPATGRPATVTEYEDGHRTYEEIKPTAQTQATTPRVEGTPLPGGGFDNSHPIVVNRDANGQQIGPARELTAEERQRWERENGQQQTASDTKPLDGYPGWTVRTTKVGNDTKTVFVNPQGQEAPDPRPAANQGASDTKPLEGYPGWTVRTTKVGNDTKTVFVNPQGQEATDPRPAAAKYVKTQFDEENGVWWGLTPDGRWERMQGGPGTTPSGRGAGPSAPQIILGHSTEGLRQYGDTLNQAVADGTLTPAQATQRWNQAVQTAQVAYNEATILQREQESNLNASVSLANTRMSAANSGFNTALQVVANLNDKLPVGSNLGGQAFAAILGLQMAHAQRMGAYDNIRPGSQPSIRDIMSQPSSPPPGPAAAPAAPPPAQAPDTAPPPPVASPAVDQAPASPPLITQPSLITSPPPEPPAGEPESTLPNFTDPTTGRFGIPGSFATGPYTAPEPQGAASPTSDYPVLAGLAPPPPPPPTPTAFTSEPTYGSLPPALLYTQAAATPFWRMSPEEVAAYQAAGIPDDVIRSGTMVTA